MMGKPVICTIIAKNYLAHARCLTDSFLEHHPDGQVFVLVIDEWDGYFDPSRERFTTVSISEIGVKDLGAMIYRYTVLELSTAVKPFFLEHLFRHFGCEKVCYFDPDIYFYKPVDEIWDLLDSYGIVLIPHLLDFLDDEFRPTELDILRAGSYNLGFIGLSKHPELFRFLHWWQRKVSKHCVVAIEKGLFVDQKWMDLAPSLFSSVYIHRDPGCNLAYWNLNHRHIEYKDGEYTVNGVPLKFLHFSGFSPDRMDVLSKHQNRFTFQDLPNVKPLFEAYRDCLLAHGYATAKQWPYTYNHHSASGVRIPDIARTLWEDWESHNPLWHSLDRESLITHFLSWLNEPVDSTHPLLTRLAMVIYQRRADLQRAFPDVLGRDGHQYVRWFLTRARVEHSLDDFFIQPMEGSQKATIGRQQLVGWFRRLRARFYMNFTSRLFRIGVGPWLERKLGQRFISLVRNFFLQPGQQAIPTPPPSLTVATTQKAPIETRAGEKERLSINEIGLNVVGYLCDETGVGEVARAYMKALQKQGCPVAYTMVSSYTARKNDRSVLHMPEGHPYAFNLFHVNADQVRIVYNELGSDFFAGKYNIGYWLWELWPFPDEWLDRFQYFHEIWVSSSFVQDILAHASPIPVLVIGVPVEKRPNPGITRSQLGLPEDKFLFLFAFDMLSYIERKNPFGLIEAYRGAFGPKAQDTQLVIKVANLDQFPQHRGPLEEAIRSVSGILIDGYLDRKELDGLFHLVDAYVSLYRSEGFGLTIAEAMCIGKPTIATAYSSVQDYMTPANSYPVGYRLIELEEDYGPYKKGGVWADPDLDHAAAQMRRVFENPDKAARIGRQAALDMQRMYSGEVIAQKVINRLNKIISWSR